MPDDDVLDWADRLVIQIKLVESLDQSADEVWRAEFQDSRFERDEAVTALLDVVESEPGTNYALDVKRSYTSWGFDAAAADVVLWLAQAAAQTTVGNAAWSAVKALARRHRDGAQVDEVPLDREEAVARARWHVAAAYDLPGPGDSLRLESESHDAQDQRWEVVLSDDDSRYEVDLRSEGGLVELVRLKAQPPALGRHPALRDGSNEVH